MFGFSFFFSYPEQYLNSMTTKHYKCPAYVSVSNILTNVSLIKTNLLPIQLCAACMKTELYLRNLISFSFGQPFQNWLQLSVSPWTFSMCTLRQSFLVNFLWHSWHSAMGRFGLCVSLCLLSIFFKLNDRSHTQKTHKNTAEFSLSTVAAGETEDDL